MSIKRATPEEKADGTASPELTAKASAAEWERKAKAAEQEVRRLKRANEILKTASISSRPSSTVNQEVIAFIDGHQNNKTDGLKWGVEPICEVLQFPSSTYHDSKTRVPSARSIRDEQLKPMIEKCFDDNYRVHGADKIWEQLLAGST